MSKGCMAYEVILAEPVGVPAPVPRSANSQAKIPSVEEIQQKLKAAEERRRSLEASKMAAIAQKMAKIEEASRFRSEQTNNFILSTKEALDAKMDSHEKKREAYINELRARLKDHLERVEKTRYKANQDKVNKKLRERLRSAEIEEQAKKVRARNQERYEQLESIFQERLQLTAEIMMLRKNEQKKMELEKKLDFVKAKLAELSSSFLQLTAKPEEIDKKIERLAELERQNKNARAESDPSAAGPSQLQ